MLISSYEPSIISLIETWLTPSTDDAEISLNNCTVFRANRVQTRGGVALNIRFSLKPVRLQLDIDASPCIETICCSINIFPSQTTLLLETPTQLPQAINLSSERFDVRPLPQENVLSLFTLPMRTGQGVQR